MVGRAISIPAQSVRVRQPRTVQQSTHNPIGRALTILGQHGQELVQAQQAAADDAEGRLAIAKFKSSFVSQYQERLTQGHENLFEDSRSIAQGLKNDTVGSLNPRLAEAVGGEIDLFLLGQAPSIQSDARKLMLGQARSDLGEAVDLYSQQFLSATDGPMRQDALSQITSALDAAGESGILTRAAANDIGDATIDKLQRAFAKRLINDDPAAVADALTDQDQFVGLDPVARETIRGQANKAADARERQRLADIARAQAERDEQLAREREIRASNLEIQVARDEAGYAEVEQAFLNEDITGSKRTQLYLALDGKVVSAKETANRAQLVESALQFGVRLDSKDKDHVKAVDEAFASVQESIANEPEDVALTRVSTFVSDVGVVPTQLRSLMRTFSRSGDAQQSVLAAKIVGRLSEEAPEVMSTLPEDEKAFGVMASDLMDAGMDSGTAIEVSRQRIYETPEAERKAIRERLSASGVEKGNQSALTELIDDNFDSFLPFNQPQAPLQLEAEFGELVSGYFVKTQDLELSRKLAGKDILGVWGLTDLNGDRQIMKFPPELVYGNGVDDWIENQFKADVEEFGAASEAITIGVDDRTAREPQPSWPLFVKTESGLVEPLFNQDNTPARWRPDFRKSPEFAEMVEEQEQNLHESRVERAVRDPKIMQIDEFVRLIKTEI